MINVLLVDDHIYIRKAIQYLLAITKDINVVATASNGVEAVTAARFSQPDVVVMDISMPVMDGLDATRKILQEYPVMRVLMLSSFDTEEYILRALKAGATGYMVKNAIAGELVEAIRSLYGGMRYFCRQIRDKVNLYIEQDSDSRIV